METIVVIDETGFLKKGKHSAGVPDEVEFATKPAARWVTGDSVYGSNCP